MHGLNQTMLVKPAPGNFMIHTSDMLIEVVTAGRVERQFDIEPFFCKNSPALIRQW